MDGVLLAGGLASRLGPITKVTNKHLLPIYNKPMIFYGIETLKELGCERVIIILGGNSVGDIVNLVRDGSQFGVEVVYKFQNEPKGISHAISLARDIIDVDEISLPPFLVLLGDNIFGNVESLKKSVKEWEDSMRYRPHFSNGFLATPEPDAQERMRYAIFLTNSSNPHNYGQPILINKGMKIDRFVEKDSSVNHNLIVTGLYGLNVGVFWDILKQEPSDRGEYEITDTLTKHLPYVTPYRYEGFWSDCGTPEGLAEATQYFMKGDKNGVANTGWKKGSANVPRMSVPS